jgi:hypothetical protein
LIVRLSHPWKWHRTRDVLDTEDGDLTEGEALRLIRGGIARDVDELIGAGEGGWYSVKLSDGKTKRYRGRANAIRALRRDAW